MRWLPTILLCAILLSGCAYHFQGKKNPLRDLGIQKIYVTSFVNKTYRPGVEQLFTTAMIREIQKSGSFQLVNSEKEADAMLSGQVSAVESYIATKVNVQIETPPTGTKEVPRSVDAASEFISSVNCAVTLTDRFGRVIFTRIESANKNYPGSTRLGEAGATVPLVNDSEQRLTIQFLASQMMASAYQRMIDVF
jgi:hypothetical protein